jgi:mRNA interferase MazF
VTSRAKGYPFEVPIGPKLSVQGVILADQLKSFDWRIRRFKFICKADRTAVQQTRELVAELLGT